MSVGLSWIELHLMEASLLMLVTVGMGLMRELRRGIGRSCGIEQGGCWI